MLQFRLFGVPYQVAGSFWITSLLLGGLGQDLNSPKGLLRLVLWVACVFVSIAVHELGHALVGRRLGGEPHVLLYSMGGVAYGSATQSSSGQRILVYLAGPAFGFLLYLAVWVFNAAYDPRHLLRQDPHGLLPYSVVVATSYLLYINGVWTLFNLLPILPLDGGQVFRDLLGPSYALLARGISFALAAVLAFWALLQGEYYIALFLGYLAYSNLETDDPSLPGGR